MKKKLIALMLAGVILIQSTGISWASEFSDGVNAEYSNVMEDDNEVEMFSDDKTKTEDFEEDSSETDFMEDAEIPAMASNDNSGEEMRLSFNNGTLIISGNGEITQTLIKNCGHSLSEIKKVIIKKGVTSIGEYAFAYCSSLKSVEIPNSIISINFWAFGCCSSIRSLEIPNSVTSIDNCAFYACSSLKNVELPSSITTIGYSTFASCTNLDNVKIPNSVTSIGSVAFSGCSSLRSIEISNSVTSIKEYAFSNCSSLSDVYYTGNKTQWEKISIGKENDQLLKVTIHYNNTISANKKFEISINEKTPIIFGTTNTISVSFEASISGNVANEERAITWQSSNPAIAEIDLRTTRLIDSGDRNSAFGWINLLTYDVGEVVITGTTQDGRTASVKIDVEAKLQTQTSQFNISEKTAVTLCSVQLKNGNKKYLESFMKNLKVQDTGSYLAGPYVKIDKTEYHISDDGKMAELICTVTPVGDGSESSKITCTSPNGQSISVSIGKESIGTFDRDIDQYVLSEVKKYTNDKVYAQYDAIMSSKTSGDEKLRRLNELFSNAGITDIKEGVQYISEVNSHQRSYRYLTTNEIYCAYNFLAWLYDGIQGNLRRGLLYADGLIFNGEIFDYTDLSTFTEVDYPGVKKNKALLKKIIEMDNSNIGTTTFKNANTLAKYLKNILSLNDIKSTAEMDHVMNEIVNCTSSEKLTDLQNQFVELLDKELKHNNKGTVYFDGELFSKALGKAGKILKFGGALAEDITAVINLQNDLEKYNKNSRFLQNIYQNKDVSFEMRLAAYRIEYELKTGYYYQLTSALGDIMDFGEDMLYTDKSIVSKYLNKVGVSSETTGSFGDAFSTIKFATFVSNIVVDMGDFVKQAAYTQGYGELSVLYSLKLEEDKKVFLKKQSYENAWTFFEDYTMLWNLRKMGEKQYLSMNEVKMYLFSKVPTLNYNMKVEIVKDTLSELEKCKFNIPSQYTIPASVQYSEKAVIHCPVDVAVCLKNGKQIAYLKDGIESDVTNNYGRFAVVRESYSGEYVKVVCLNDKENVEFKIIGTADGTMQMEFAKSDDKTTGNIYKIGEVTVSSKLVIQTSVSDIVDKNVYYVDKDGDGKIDETGNFIVTDDTSWTPVPTQPAKPTITPTPTVSPVIKPSTPNLSKITASYNSITVKWNTVSDANSYQVYRKVNSGKWKAVKNVTGTSYKDKNVKVGYKYSYTVKAYKTTNGKKVYSAYNKKGLSGKLNTNISLSAKTKTVAVSWKKTTGASGYYVYRSSSRTGKFSKIKTTKTLKYTDSKVKEGNTYYYKVVPFRKINNKNVSGGSSSIKNVTLAKGQTTNGSSYKFIDGVNKIIPQLEEKELDGRNYYEKSFELDEHEHISFQYIKENDGHSYFSIVCQPDITQQGNYIVLGWNEGEAKPRVSVFYVKESGYKVMGYLSYQSEGNKYIVDFTQNSTVKFEFNSTPESDKYTLKQLNTMGNETFHEVLQMLDSCMKQNMNMSIIDLGFENY